MIFRKGELFSGPGGLALAASRAQFTHNEEEWGIQSAWAYDYDADAVATYNANIPSAGDKDSAHEGDVRHLEIDKIDKDSINAFCFGFPCNDFSNVGERKGLDGEFGPLYTYGVKVINRCNPLWFLAENVGGLQNSNDGNAFSQILNALSTAGTCGGYYLVPHLYKFEEYGVPQARHRIIIVGIQKQYADKHQVVYQVPKPILQPGQFISARKALEGGPFPSDEEYDERTITAFKRLPAGPIPDTAPNQEATRHPQRTIDRLNLISPGENAWNALRLAENPDLQLNVKGAKLSSIYRRLHPDQPSYTVTGSGGGGTHIYHYAAPRALTNRERARLQTFPDDFVFKGSKESQRAQIGMAVPPAGAEIIFEAILRSFAHVPYESVPSKWNIADFIGEL